MRIVLPKNVYKIATQRANVVEKFRKVSGTVWVCFQDLIQENTLKEERPDKSDSNDNYNYYGEGCSKH